MELRKTDAFAAWLDGLRDIRARARIQARIERLAAGKPGDVEPIGEGVSELRIRYGPGYRVCFKQKGRELVILLGGGDKSTQANAHEGVADTPEHGSDFHAKDIRSALRLARNLVE